LRILVVKTYQNPNIINPPKKKNDHPPAGFIHITLKEQSMENQNKTKSNLGISLLTVCGTSLAAFVFPVVFFYALVMWLLPSESGFFIQMVCGLGSGVILALVAAIAVGVAVFRAKQPRPLASGLLSWAGISILMNIAIAGLGSLVNNYIPTLATTTTESSNFFSILMAVEVVIILIANVLAIVGGWLVYRLQKSKLKQG
jgi:hypothetical protein